MRHVKVSSKKSVMFIIFISDKEPFQHIFLHLGVKSSIGRCFFIREFSTSALFGWQCWGTRIFKCSSKVNTKICLSDENSGPGAKVMATKCFSMKFS